MLKNLLLIAFGLVLGIAAMLAREFRTNEAHVVPPHSGLEESFTALASAVAGAGDFVQEHRWYGSPREQAEAYRHIVRALIAALETYALSDPDFPYFYELNPFSKSGMDNSDQRYLITLLDGTGEYRVWGERGSSRRLDFSLYKDGGPMAPSFATLATEQLAQAEDGSFELFIGGAPRERNWLPGYVYPLRMLIRQIHSDWSVERPGQVHIDRIDAARPLYPQLSRESMAANLRAAANAFADGVRRWPEMSRTRFATLLPANFLTPPQDTGAEGGLAGRWMVGGHFDLAADEALVITTRPTAAAYQGIQLGHHWWESLDYANRQTSLTLDQANVSGDGVIYFVVSSSDPGVANWLDTEGFRRGVILMRYDGLAGALPQNAVPVAELVKMDELREHVPADQFYVQPARRARAIAERRRHVQRRFGL